MSSLQDRLKAMKERLESCNEVLATVRQHHGNRVASAVAMMSAIEVTHQTLHVALRAESMNLQRFNTVMCTCMQQLGEVVDSFAIEFEAFGDPKADPDGVKAKIKELEPFIDSISKRMIEQAQAEFDAADVMFRKLMGGEASGE